MGHTSAKVQEFLTKTPFNFIHVDPLTGADFCQMQGTVTPLPTTLVYNNEGILIAKFRAVVSEKQLLEIESYIVKNASVNKTTEIQRK